jgi:hypothetical protein
LRSIDVLSSNPSMCAIAALPQPWRKQRLIRYPNVARPAGTRCFITFAGSQIHTAFSCTAAIRKHRSVSSGSDLLPILPKSSRKPSTISKALRLTSMALVHTLRTAVGALGSPE